MPGTLDPGLRVPVAWKAPASYFAVRSPTMTGLATGPALNFSVPMGTKAGASFNANSPSVKRKNAVFGFSFAAGIGVNSSSDSLPSRVAS